MLRSEKVLARDQVLREENLASTDIGDENSEKEKKTGDIQSQSSASQPKSRPGSWTLEDSQALQGSTEKSVIKPYVPPFTFPQKHKQKATDKQFVQFLNMFKKLHINIPFAKALAQMPKYAKFMKEILRNKRKLEDHETVMLNEECSAILINKLLYLAP